MDPHSDQYVCVVLQLAFMRPEELNDAIKENKDLQGESENADTENRDLEYGKTEASEAQNATSNQKGEQDKTFVQAKDIETAFTRSTFNA